MFFRIPLLTFNVFFYFSTLPVTFKSFFFFNKTQQQQQTKNTITFCMLNYYNIFYNNYRSEYEFNFQDLAVNHYRCNVFFITAKCFGHYLIII